MKAPRLLGPVALCAVLSSPTWSCAAEAQTPKRVHEVAKPRVMPDGGPKASDVVMRSLRLRVAKGKSQYDTYQALSDFHVTRLEWTYVRDADFIAKVRASGRLFGGAASSALSHVAKTQEGLDFSEIACVDLNGTPVVPTWKRTWRPPGNLWMCVNDPMLERLYLEYLKSCLDAGARIMQRDEPGGNENAVNWGGCFCDHCTRAFRDYLKANTTPDERRQLGIDDVGSFDYRELLKRQGAPVGDKFKRSDGGELQEHFVRFQAEATRAFHQRTRRALDEYAGRRVAFSCNNGCRRWTPTEMLFDWCFGELSYRHATPDFILDAMREAAAVGRHQVVTMPKKADREELDAWRRLTRQTIAMAYACGGQCMVPWDVYMPGDAPRYFGTPEEYADLYGFIRGASPHLDGYEYAGAFGLGLDSGLYGDEPPVRVPDGSQVAAVVRAFPGRADGAVVVHLVDWSDAPRPLRLTLNPAALFGDKPLDLKLLAPTPYDKDAHRKAEQSRSYGALVDTVPLEGGYVASVSVPALNPWGLLVIEPAGPTGTGVWQPAVRTEQMGCYREALAVCIRCALPGAGVHYTTDGSEPTTASPRYVGPIKLTASATVKAVAVMPDGRTSRVGSASYRKFPGGPKQAAPDSKPLKASLKLWLKADALSLADGEPVKTWTASAGPDAVAEPHKTFDGNLTQAPTFKADAMHGRPAVQFDGVDDSLAVKGFANRYLAGKAFTIFMVTQSDTGGFGMCGNGISGSGGDPRLYLQRTAFRYDKLDEPVSLRPVSDGPTISAFMHDGDETIRAATDGVLGTPVSGLPVVPQFGSGGHLAMPFWSGNKNCPGDVAEIVVFDRELTEAERIGVEAYLAERYAVRYVRRWE